MKSVNSTSIQQKRVLMKSIAGVLIAAFVLIGCQGGKQQGGMKSLATRQDSISYLLGRIEQKQFSQDSIKWNYDALTFGMMDELQDTSKQYLKEAQLQDLYASFMEERGRHHEERMKDLAMKNAKEEKDFLEKNAKAEGVHVLKSGLQFKVMTAGTENGPSPKLDQVVTFHVRGTLLDGTEVMSSLQASAPPSVPMNNLPLKGWVEALQLMKAKSKWTVWIPSNLAYGEQGDRSRGIPPNSMIILELELFGFHTDTTPPQARQRHE
jgi:FKBP-type peptidyl-prolyl cis-trans isomerase FklB